MFKNYERFFTIEAWIRYDKLKPMARGKHAYIYKIQKGNNINGTNVQKLALIVGNSFFRVDLGGKRVDLGDDFENNTNWRFIAATFKKSDDYKTTDLDMYIDNTKSKKDVVIYKIFNAALDDYSIIGHNWHG